MAAPENWGCVDVISDLHLNSLDLATFTSWKSYLAHSSSDAIFILGDLFDVWVGDDCLDVVESFERQCADVLRQASHQRPLFFMPGNRDFLISSGFFSYCNIQGLSDPTVFSMGSHRWLLSHGDMLCIDDIPYQEFRSIVRTTAWQERFLSQPLSVRRDQARSIRSASESRKMSEKTCVDIDLHTAQAWLSTYDATALIHGHTHQPSDQLLPNGLWRHVLSDWDLSATPPRSEILRLTQNGVSRVPL